ncbi:bis(5'-nucleosyl)-tetraphosphatase, symmetrical [Chitinimonas prasina]|uniref:Bis(5'-nucleosyl)-tetraphosphatase, symmetrical n=1 Tax=Chitinimonas prasina TaxID=1434937 RepID=A0ABQ5YMG3_9NEIS|nr:symmetrical bis(5'-nucleosyl)-tetraphosphatase [Chitinimonas prasina]GLR14114.1 bis(5'-nucleosyl)-tetraphosphatase, symmetrical [Chitinimonas prasina]
MASYAIGDLQGCYQEFLDLLAEMAFQPDRDRLFLVGDLVNRGPDSLAVLRWVYQHRDCVDIVLGNHDLHLLAVQAGLARQKGRDTLAEVLAAPDAPLLLDWLRCQPLVRRCGGFLFVHAGLLPDWTAQQAVALSAEVEAVLASAGYKEFLGQMYGNQPSRWHEGLVGIDRLRLVVNVCTRMRLLTDTGALDLDFKGELDNAPAYLHAWFDAPDRQQQDVCIVSGHWSALGLMLRPDVIALDTGCVWGGSLAGVRLEDRQVFQVPSRQARSSDWG